MDNRETQTTVPSNTIAHQRVHRDTCAMQILKTFLTPEEIVFANTVMCCLLLPRIKQDTRDPSDLFLKGSL